MSDLSWQLPWVTGYWSGLHQQGPLPRKEDLTGAGSWTISSIARVARRVECAVGGGGAEGCTGTTF